MATSQLMHRLLLPLVLSCFGAAGCQSAPKEELEYTSVFSAKTSDTQIVYLRFNEEGDSLLSAPRYYSVHLLKAESGELVNHYEFDASLAGLEFIDTGEIFVAKREGNVELWSADLSQLHKSHDFDLRERMASISSNGQWGFFGTHFFSWADKLKEHIEVPHAGIARLAFYEPNYAVSMGAHDGAISTIELSTLTRSEWQAPDTFRALGSFATRPLIIAVTEEGMAYGVDVSTQEVRYQFPLSGNPISVITDPNNEWFAIAYPSEIRVFKALTGEPLFRTKLDDTWSQLAASSRQLFIGGSEGSLYVLDLATQAIATADLFDQSAIGALAWHEPTRSLAVGSRDGETMLIRLDNIQRSSFLGDNSQE